MTRLTVDAAILESRQRNTTVKLDGEVEEHNALYSRCSGLKDHSGNEVEFWNAGWSILLHRIDLDSEGAPIKPGTDRDSLLMPGQRWYWAGQDVFVAAWAMPLERVDAPQVLKILESTEHDATGVHLRLHAGAMVVSLRQDVWQLVRRALGVTP